VLEEGAPDVGDDAVPEMHVEVTSPIHDESVHERGQRRELGHQDERGAPLLEGDGGGRRRDRVNDRTDDPRIDVREPEAEHPEDDRERHVLAMRADVAEEIAQKPERPS
jgi:hypothetical protein